MTYNFNLLN